MKPKSRIILKGSLKPTRYASKEDATTAFEMEELMEFLLDDGFDESVTESDVRLED
jgi:hypothetical protein